MNTRLSSSDSVVAAVRPRPVGLVRCSVFALVALVGATGLSVSAQDAAAGADAQGNRRRAGAPADSAGERGDRRNMTPQDMQARMLSSLRERLEVPDDEEWKLISERVAKVMELRRTAGGGMPMIAAFAGRGGPQGGGPGGDARGARGGRGGRGGPGGNAELAALSTAVRDKLPDAEIKARLERLRESRKESESKLTRAQDELRGVLTVRQEAVAVVFGLLP